MPTCDRCGGFVTADFARVFGDNDDRLSGCLDCTPRERLADSAANSRQMR